MEEGKDGKKIIYETVNESLNLSDGITVTLNVTAGEFQAFDKLTRGKHLEDGPDVLKVVAPAKTTIKQHRGTEVIGTMTLNSMAGRSFKTTFAPGPEIGCLRFLIGGELYEIGGMKFTPEDWRTEDWRGFADKLDERNADRGFMIPEREPQPENILKPIRDNFAIAAGFVPMHKLSERNRAGLPLFPEGSRTFHALRTPLNVAAGLALFRFTSPERPGDWQEVTMKALTDQVYCLTERDAPRRGDHAPDVLGEVVKLFAETIAIVQPRFEKHGRIWKSRVELIFDRVIATLGLTYIDTKTGRRVRPDDPTLPRAAIVPLAVKGRRVYTPEGRDIKALIGDRWKLETIRWRWSPTIVDDLLAAPVLDKKGNVIRDKSGKVIRGGFNIRVIIRIFDALFRLRSERAYTAHDLLVLLATDIYKPPKQSTAGRNIIERETDRLFDLLGLEDDPKHPGRREEAVAGAIFRLKQPDIGALLPGTDENPRIDPNPDRRKRSYYRLIRSALYTPPGIMTKEEAAAIEAEYEAAPEPLTLPDPKKTKVDQVALPGIVEDTQPIPSGADIGNAIKAAGGNLRRFAEMINDGIIEGGSFNTWARYIRGERIKVNKISPEAWQRVREFIAQHGKGT